MEIWSSGGNSGRNKDLSYLSGVSWGRRGASQWLQTFRLRKEQISIEVRTSQQVRRVLGKSLKLTETSKREDTVKEPCRQYGMGCVQRFWNYMGWGTNSYSKVERWRRCIKISEIVTGYFWMEKWGRGFWMVKQISGGQYREQFRFKSDTHTHTHRVCFSEFMKKLLYVFF